MDTPVGNQVPKIKQENDPSSKSILVSNNSELKDTGSVMKHCIIHPIYNSNALLLTLVSALLFF